ncbi:MAG: sulfatase [Planctomycetota bacterium]
MTSRMTFFHRCLLALPICVLLGTAAAASDRPNILWLSTEDISCDLGCYGDAVAKTPTLDQLAADGVRYDNAYTAAPVCAVVRSGIITGVYPVSIGTHHMRCRVPPPPDIKCFTAYLREAGYYCTNNSKQDYNFRPSKDAWDQSSGKAHWKNRPRGDQPFFAVFNYTGTHESRVRGDQPAYNNAIKNLRPEQKTDPAEVELRPYHPDTPKVRETYVRSYNTIAALDDWVADHLKQLEDAGLADNTIVVFWSDHGTSLPRGKRWLYDSGTKIPLIVRVPEKWRAMVNAPEGGMTDELVSSIDFAPTTLNLAGLEIPDYMHGRAFLGPKRTAERDHIFLHRDRMDERYEMSRAAVTKRYKYIRNFTHWRPWTQWLGYAEQSPIMQELRRLKGEGKVSPEQARWLAAAKPPEEFYDLEADRHELNNLIGSAEHAEPIEAMRAWLSKKMHGIRDLGVFPEGELHRLGETAGNQGAVATLLSPARDSLSGYSALLRAAEFVASPPPPPGDPVINTLLYGGRDKGDEPVGPTAMVWGFRVFTASPAFADASNRSDDLVASINLDANALPETAKVAAAELCVKAGALDQAISLLSEVMLNKNAGFARVEAINALDLVPNMEDYADQLRPIARKLREELGTRKVNQTAADYMRRCLDRLEDRLEATPES